MKKRRRYFLSFLIIFHIVYINNRLNYKQKKKKTVHISKINDKLRIKKKTKC